MEDNAILRAIKERRSIIRFEPKPVSEEQLQTILEAGRWAPSFANSQPWEFIVVREKGLLAELNGLVQRIAIARRGKVVISKAGLGEAPLAIVVAVDPWKDLQHHVEAGTAAAQNMALAAHSLGLASYWAGVYSPRGGRGTPEAKIKKLLDIPEEHRVIALLPIGFPAYKDQGERRELAELVHYDRYRGGGKEEK
ncbi:MAG: nitroreductase family protein [Candidatus Acetothermia bacterium]|nr:nitroreductase family protein [Candidatus Acetothermia bacterium]MDH7505798.1 nitroreductase family protein [Candidatus Acetothermia bacterium]